MFKFVVMNLKKKIKFMCRFGNEALLLFFSMPYFINDCLQTILFIKKTSFFFFVIIQIWVSKEKT
jgi:hypothetical protein